MPGLVASDRVTLRGGEHLRHDVALQLGSLQETIRLWASEAPEPLPASSASTAASAGAVTAAGATRSAAAPAAAAAGTLRQPA